LLEAESAGIEAIGIEAHPFVAKVAQAKLSWRQNPLEFYEYASDLLLRAKNEKIITKNILTLYKNAIL
jgi:hypothetical protein